MRILVQKYGGSSVGDESRREKVIEKILAAKKKGYNVVVVLSAMGRKPDPYATDSLINLIKCSKDHQVCPRDQDLLMSCGEIISCVVLAQMLRDRGYDSIALTGWQAGIITDNNFSESHILRIHPVQIIANLKKGKIPVIAGFQGITEDGEVTTLGRGGSDTTATALGAALGAEMVEIFTDVDGVMTADPKVLPNPRTIPELHYEEAGEMSGEGAKVLHKRCIAPAAMFGIPLWIKSTLTDNPGTRVTSYEDTETFEKFESGRVVTGIVQVTDVAQMVADFIDAQDRALMRLEFLRMLREAGVSLDLISIVREKLYFIVQEHQVMDVVGVCKTLNLPVTITHDCAKVSCVGIGMKGTPGVMAAIQEALAAVNVNVLHATDSHITISCLIKRKDLEIAVGALADKFNLRG